MKKYEFDRKFLFRVLVLGNAQLGMILLRYYLLVIYFLLLLISIWKHMVLTF
jgi:hypothetical protein